MREFHWGRIPQAANDAEIDPGREIANTDSFESLYAAIRRMPVWENSFALDGRESAEAVIKQIEKIRARENQKAGHRDRRLIEQSTLLVPKQHGLKQKVRELLIAEGAGQ